MDRLLLLDHDNLPQLDLFTAASRTEDVLLSLLVLFDDKASTEFNGL